MDRIHARKPIEYLIHGDCKTGADQYASAWCKIAKGVTEVKVPAMWARNGKAAGPIRNRSMGALRKIDLVIAFPGGNGTEDMVKVAKKLGIKVKRIKANRVGLKKL